MLFFGKLKIAKNIKFQEKKRSDSGMIELLKPIEINSVGYRNVFIRGGYAALMICVLIQSCIATKNFITFIYCIYAGLLFSFKMKIEWRKQIGLEPPIDKVEGKGSEDLKKLKKDGSQKNSASEPNTAQGSIVE